MSELLLQQALQQVIVFVLILTRVGCLLMTAPGLGAHTAPMQVRALLAVGLSVLITPVFWGLTDLPETLIDLSMMVLREALLGLAIGLMLLILLTSVQVTGQVIGQLSGMQLAELFDPTFDASMPVLAKVLELGTLAVFFALGGHRHVMEALLGSFHAIPPGSATWAEHWTTALVEATRQSFDLGLRAAAPVMLSLLIAMLVVALIGRTLPQLNILAVGFSINSLVMMGVLTLTLGTAIWMFANSSADMLSGMMDYLMPGAL